MEDVQETQEIERAQESKNSGRSILIGSRRSGKLEKRKAKQQKARKKEEKWKKQKKERNKRSGRKQKK